MASLNMTSTAAFGLRFGLLAGRTCTQAAVSVPFACSSLMTVDGTQWKRAFSDHFKCISKFSSTAAGIPAPVEQNEDSEQTADKTSVHAPVPGVRAVAEGDMMVAMFTCKVCETRTARTISKSSYTRGTVLVRCPGCLNSHVLADHLGFFDDAHITADALLAAKGEAVRRGVLKAGDGDMHALNLTEADMRVLRSRAGSISKDGLELDVVPAQNILGSTPPKREEGGGVTGAGAETQGGGATPKAGPAAAKQNDTKMT